MAIFNSYVKLPEGIGLVSVYLESWPLWECTFFHAVITLIIILVIILVII